MKTGLLFGSFNPIHIGHLAVAEYFATQGGMDEVWLVVSPLNPFKNETSLAPSPDRLAMAKLAAAKNPRLLVSDFEFSLPSPSYTIDTLTALQAQFPERIFHLLMGEDLVAGLKDWKKPEEIVKRGNILVYPRNTSTILDTGFKTEPAPKLDISSTYIRACIASGFSVRYLLPDEVILFIEEKSLYR